MNRLIVPGLQSAVLAFALAAGCSLALAQDGGSSAVPLEGRAEGAPISRIDVVLRRGSGNPARDQAAVERLREALAVLEGRGYRKALIERELAGPRGRLGLGGIDYTLVAGAIPGTIGLRVEIDTAGSADGTPPVPRGVFTGDAKSFPVLYRSDRAFLTAIVNGGLGIYSDPNPWFGRTQAFIGRSPLAGNLPGRKPAWTEGFVEYGLAGAAQLGDSPFYAYAQVTGITSWSLGQDIYRDDARSKTTFEKAYGGLLYVDPATGGSLNVSFGRQNWTLNDGYLVHFVRGSANIGKRAGLYIGPRNANDFSVVVDGKLGPWSFKAFYIDPDELPLVDGRSTFAGVNLRYNFTPNLSVDGTVITIPQSDSSFALPGGIKAPREGLRTLAGHVRWNTALGIEGMWLASELAYQSSDRFPMRAFAGYGLIGYQASHLPWSPSLSYRYSYASGDDPRTARYERFDALLSTGMGNWLQGISFGKLTSNSNLAVHRLQFNLQPTPAVNLTFDWHKLRAPERNNLGSNPVIGQLTSNDIGQEYTATLRWAINRNLFLQSLVSVAVPGRALRDAGATKTGPRCNPASTGPSEGAPAMSQTALPLATLGSLLFTLMGPISAIPLFAGATTGAERGLQVKIALRAYIVALIGLAIAVFIGTGALQAWGVSAPSLIIAAGLILMLTALRSIFLRGAAPAADPSPPTIATGFSPIAIPGLVTPMAVAILVIFVSYFPSMSDKLAVMAVAAAIMTLNLGAMLCAGWFMRVIGPAPLVVLGAVFSVLQAAMGAEMILSGLSRSKLLG